MLKKSLMIAGVFFAACLLWILVIFATYKLGFPTKALLSQECVPADYIAMAESINLEDKQQIDILIVGTPNFISQIKKRIPDSNKLTIAAVPTPYPSMSQFLSSSEIFASQNPKLRVFQNAPYIWTDYHEYRNLRNIQRSIGFNSESYDGLNYMILAAKKHVKDSTELVKKFNRNCQKDTQRRLPNKMYWSIFLPPDMLEDRISFFADNDSDIFQDEKTLWVFDRSWIPSDTKPETRKKIMEFSWRSADVEGLGKFVRLGDSKSTMRKIIQSEDF